MADMFAKEVLAIAKEARDSERSRILAAFNDLAMRTVSRSESLKDDDVAVAVEQCSSAIVTLCQELEAE